MIELLNDISVEEQREHVIEQLKEMMKDPKYVFARSNLGGCFYDDPFSTSTCFIGILFPSEYRRPLQHSAVSSLATFRHRDHLIEFLNSNQLKRIKFIEEIKEHFNMLFDKLGFRFMMELQVLHDDNIVTTDEMIVLLDEFITKVRKDYNGIYSNDMG